MTLPRFIILIATVVINSSILIEAVQKRPVAFVNLQKNQNANDDKTKDGNMKIGYNGTTGDRIIIAFGIICLIMIPITFLIYFLDKKLNLWAKGTPEPVPRKSDHHGHAPVGPDGANDKTGLVERHEMKDTSSGERKDVKEVKDGHLAPDASTKGTVNEINKATDGGAKVPREGLATTTQGTETDGSDKLEKPEPPAKVRSPMKVDDGPVTTDHKK